MESVDVKMEPSSPATTPPPDMWCDDIKEETTTPSSPTPSSDMSCGDIKEETTPNSPTASSHPLDVARTPQTSSTETSRDAPVADSKTGILNGISRAPVEKCGSGAGSSSHVCDVCGRGFSTKTTLKRHHLSHTGERPYPCSICDRRFAQKGNLARHYQYHTSESKMQRCLQCSKLLTSITALEEHQKQHNSKRKLYSCHLCPSIFTVKHQLDNHVLIHAQDNQKPHACPVCKKCFSWWPSLITHMGQEHHGVESSVAGAGNSA